MPGVLLWDGLRMSVRDPGSLSRANGAYLVVNYFFRGWRFMIKRRRVGVGDALDAQHLRQP